ncbi:hypothetical protein [Dictyobacter kobayashii]|uniref:Uncharacterized protein n=1 Tax=Dictyobacter kobayashii TaxID=2014872 RepID=A0A402AIL7_9CHLR|nr:hypothetical protein [Dictyobacter kobayashii]GCE18962.1 hypothetical protein KDK_27620 [Dictyobacter kobayashii]
MIRNQSSVPVILLTKARLSWFVFNNQSYALMACSAEIFRLFVADQASITWTDQEAHQLLAQATLDDYDRWFILLSLGKFLKRNKRALPFYESRKLAENAITANSERATRPDSQSQGTYRAKRSQRVRSAKLVQTV